MNTRYVIQLYNVKGFIVQAENQYRATSHWDVSLCSYVSWFSKPLCYQAPITHHSASWRSLSGDDSSKVPMVTAAVIPLGYSAFAPKTASAHQPHISATKVSSSSLCLRPHTVHNVYETAAFILGPNRIPKPCMAGL